MRDRPAPEGPAGWLLGMAAGALERLPGGRAAVEAIGRLPAARAAIEALGRLPGARAAVEVLEDPVPAGVRNKLERVADVIAANTRVHRTPAGLLSGLLERSLEQTQEDAERDLFTLILRHIVPDEARIVAALSDGNAYPLIEVCMSSTLGGAVRTLIPNLSTIGLGAGVQLTDLTPYYIDHLATAGLLEFGGEDPSMQLKYELLESQTVVLRAFNTPGRSRIMTKIWIDRRTVRLSTLGHRLWAACGEGIEPPAAG